MSSFIEFLGTLVDIIFFTWFIPRFNNASLRKKPVLLAFPLLLLIFQLIADKFLLGFNMLYMLGIFLFALGFSFSLGNQSVFWKIFAAVVFPVVLMLSNSFVYSIFLLIFPDFSEIMAGSGDVERALFILVCKVVQLSFYRLILQIFKKEKILDLKNGILSFIFTIATAVGLGALMDVAVLNDSLNCKISVLVMAFVLIALNIMLYTMIYQIQILLKNKYMLKLMEEKTESEKLRMEEVQRIWSNIRKIKHDMQQHFNIISGYLQENNVEDCKEYVSKVSETVKKTGNIIQSGNTVIDYLVNSKLSNLDEIQVVVSGYVGNYDDIEDIDLVCILGNLLDNAVEAQNKVLVNKRIELYFIQNKANRVIICKNSILNSVLNKNKSLISTKDSSEFHGIGHQIIENKVEKYHGLIRYFEEEKMFGVQIILPNNN